MQTNLNIHSYETGEKSFYAPPPAIKTLLNWDEGTLPQEVIEFIATLSLIHKLYGYVQCNTRLLLKRIIEKLPPETQRFLSEYEFNSADEVFTYNYERQHFGDDTCVVSASDGYLYHAEIIKNLESDDLIMKLFTGREHLLREMLGLPKDSDNNLESFEGGFYDVTVLEPEHKHVITVPMKSIIKDMYLVDEKQNIYPCTDDKKVKKKKMFPTNPAYALKYSNKKIIDGNLRLVCLLEGEINGEKIDYIMIGHTAAFVSGIESIREKGDTIEPGEILFKFHIGSTVSTIYPKTFFDHMQFIPELKKKTSGQNLLELEEGNVLYVPKNLKNKTIAVNKTKEVRADIAGNLKLHDIKNNN